MAFHFSAFVWACKWPWSSLPATFAVWSAPTRREFDLQTPHPVIHLMAEQKAIDTKGGTMRLGSYPCVLQNETLAAKLYGREKISERHRHRYEFNNNYRAEFGAKGWS